MSDTNNPLLSLFSTQAADAEANADKANEDMIFSLMGKESLPTLDPTARREEIDLMVAGQNLEELAALDVTNIAVIKSNADRVTSMADRFVLRDAESFKTVADALDAAMQSDSRFTSFGLDSVRNYVMTLMTTISHDEELATILLDRDIRNCILFARETYAAQGETEALVNRAKADRKSASAAKPPTAKAAKISAASKIAASIDFDSLFKM